MSNYVKKEGEGQWRTLPKKAGLLRCGKSCRLRWMNYLRPSVKRGRIAPDEEDLILRLHRLLGNRYIYFLIDLDLESISALIALILTVPSILIYRKIRFEDYITFNSGI